MTPPIGRNDRDAQVRAAAVAFGWKTAGGGFFYRVNDTYLFEMSVQWQNSSAPVGMIKTKPLALDPLFWEIVGLPALQKKRVSFRVNGVFTVPSLVAASVALTDEASPDEVVERLHGHFVDVEKRFQTLLDFEELIVANTDWDGTTRSTLMTWMLAAGRRTEAERLARVGLTSNNGGFLFSGGPVEDLVLDYLGFHAERGSHVVLINGTRLSIFPGYARSPEQRLRGWLSLMDGQRWFAVALWKLPRDADRQVRDDRWEAGSYIQCAGGPDRFIVECRVDEVGGAKQVVLGDPRGDYKTTVVVQRGEFTSKVFANEVFGPDEVIRLFLEHCDHGSIPGGVAMRPIRTSPDPAEERLDSVGAPPTSAQGLPESETVNAEFETLSLRLHAEGWSDRVTVERLIAEWKHLSATVSSYPLSIDDYTNDLAARDAIELVLGWATDAVRSGIGESIEEADAAFRASTVYDGGIAVGSFFRVDSASGWWWRRRPTSGDLGAYLDRVL